MVKVEHLKKNFGDLEVLKDINLTVAEGEKLVIIGPSGSGKSTFIRCINHLEEPTSGTISIAGTPVTKRTAWKWQKIFFHGIPAVQPVSTPDRSGKPDTGSCKTSACA